MSSTSGKNTFPIMMQKVSFLWISLRKDPVQYIANYRYTCEDLLKNTVAYF